MELDNLIDMMKEFDYRKNGKFLTLRFLLDMYEYFYELEEWGEQYENDK